MGNRAMAYCIVPRPVFFSVVLQNAAQVVHLLLDHKADADVLCNGHSPLSLAIISGNDLVSLGLGDIQVHTIGFYQPLSTGV